MDETCTPAPMPRIEPRASCWFCLAPLRDGLCPDCDRDAEPTWPPETAKAASASHAPTAF